MKYIRIRESGGWFLDDYFSYIESVANVLPPEVYDFAKDASNYDLRSHQSLHDSWLEELSLSETALGNRKQFRDTQICVRLLGPYHDLRIRLHYLGVVSYSLVAQSSTKGHEDLLIHEVRSEPDNFVTHELIFSSGATLSITCVRFTHAIEQIE